MDDTGRHFSGAPLDKNFSKDENLNTVLNNIVGEVTSYADHLREQIKKLTDIGRALSGVNDLNALLETIVDQARQFTQADAGTLYIVEDNKLRFKIVQNDSLNIRLGGQTGDAIEFDPVEMKESNVSAFVALHGIPVNIPDVYDTNLFDFTGPKNFDAQYGYRSKSMLVVPMRNHENDIIGVLQLLNSCCKRTQEVHAFSPDFESLTESLASQAAIAITNVKLISDMERLFESFVQVMATAIDEKSPVTGGHIRRVANLTVLMAEEIHKINEGPFKNIRYTPEQLYEIKVAGWMHDIGKVTTPVEIIEKSKKLQTIFDRIHHVDLRLEYAIHCALTEKLQAMLNLKNAGASEEEIKKAEEEGDSKANELREIRKFIQFCNEPREFLDDERVERLRSIREMSFMGLDGTVHNLLTDDELENLSIRKGSITEGERQVMKNHAKITLDMLSQIPFTKKLRNLPHFAGAHHECINGKGYPLGLSGENIPFEGKMMAVTDIAEALTAIDRPYKKAMPLSNVYRILRTMAEHEELDQGLVEFFIENKIYEKYKEKFEPDEVAEESPPETREPAPKPVPKA
ncbi:MAG: GAF domain-containing protein [Candidatus Nitronauta litoralis]|uniref:GAF domain-containing protein n=1 Tax=Candidatus Nitronauta litoralis TaxID=2705533 RepID=A0A7T0G1E2_9BACT|nr:MAG: GAF domain-containing protein [Candidatus Nitronauta litoralis]